MKISVKELFLVYIIITSSLKVIDQVKNKSFTAFFLISLRKEKSLKYNIIFLYIHIEIIKVHPIIKHTDRASLLKNCDLSIYCT